MPAKLHLLSMRGHGGWLSWQDETQVTFVLLENPTTLFKSRQLLRRVEVRDVSEVISKVADSSRFIQKFKHLHRHFIDDMFPRLAVARIVDRRLLRALL